MREIKFRGYGNIGNGKEELFYCSDLPEVGIIEENYFVEWMQRTGLTDKNGKEIYEGDIDINYGKVKFGQYEEEINIKYIYDNYGYYFEDKDGVCIGLHPDDSYEIIGNIYENP